MTSMVNSAICREIVSVVQTEKVFGYIPEDFLYMSL